jgi:hypothetical protein
LVTPLLKTINTVNGKAIIKASIDGNPKTAETKKAEAEPEARHLPCSPPVHLDPLEVVPSLREKKGIREDKKKG